MKYLLLIFTILIFSCEKDEKIAPNYKKNIVFYATGGAHTITIKDVGYYVIMKDPANPYPQCTSSYDANSKYLILYLKEGRYEVIMKDRGIFYITVKQGCNTFDVSNVYAWR